MPEYLAPGVYVEEVSFRAKSIEGVGTSTTGFIGPMRYGPPVGVPELLTSFNQFERIFGGLDPLNFAAGEMPTFMAHAVRAFFDNGGSRLYVARTYTESGGDKGIASAFIPRANPLNEATLALAKVAASDAQTSLERAKAAIGLVTAQETKDHAVAVLKNATQEVFAKASVDPPQIDFTQDNVEQKLTNWKEDDVADDDEKAAVTAKIAEVKDRLVAATAIRDEAGAKSGEADTHLDALGTAVNTGEADGKSNSIPDPLDLQAKYTALNGAYKNLKTKYTTSTAAEQDFTKEGYPFNPGADPQDVVDKANALLVAANNVVDAGDIANQVMEAAEFAHYGKRAAERDATALFKARFPGQAGNMTVTVRSRLASNVLVDDQGNKIARQIQDGDLVVVLHNGIAKLYSADRSSGDWVFKDGTADLPIGNLDVTTDQVVPLSLSLELIMPGRFAQPQLWDNLTVSSKKARAATSVNGLFAEKIANRMQELETPLVIGQKDPQTALPADAVLAADLIGRATFAVTANGRIDPITTTQTFTLIGGNDGARPVPDAYRGVGDDSTPDDGKSGLKAFEDLEDISIVAAPGSSYMQAPDPALETAIRQINQHLITHCETMRYRVAVLDSPNNQSLGQVRDYRAVMDSKYSALYYPWVRIVDPITNSELSMPPSGFMAGIYARTDVEVGVHKAPANAVVRGAVGLEVMLNKAQQDVLNPLGINCIRFFEGRGIRIWGARTISSDPEWKYLNIRRYFAYLERSIDLATQWAVFEPNGETLWANVSRAVDSFLYNEWVSDRLAGALPDVAYFVRCDRSTMTQNDLDNGRMICLIGVAPLYPAEFVIFRIGQWTADSNR